MRPVISEKATMANQENKYIFEVAIKANKIEIKKAIEEIYGVTPIAVNVMNQRGKFVRFGRKTGRTKDTKKAIVTLKKGDSITIYEGI
ncbi:50S ribosomal protein L23 [bacterium]|nr:50S ribosomal protein L23 [bacterium]MBT7552863.1 50S ribosomal protein L23 [bacterium]